jgi:hypothetical protein
MKKLLGFCLMATVSRGAVVAECRLDDERVVLAAVDPGTHYEMLAEGFSRAGHRVYVQALGEHYLMMAQIRAGAQASAELPAAAFRAGTPLKLSVSTPTGPWLECTAKWEPATSSPGPAAGA